MRILIVSGSYFPTKSPRAFRTTELARELSRQGHQVEVIIPQSDLDILEEKSRYNVQINFSYPNKTKRISQKIPFIGRLIPRIDRIVEWLFEYPAIHNVKIIKNKLKEIQYRPDLLISIAYPHTNHWGVSKFITKNPDFTKCWVADCGDPFMGATMNKIGHPFWFSKIERMWCKKVDYITIPIEGAKEAYYSEFRDKIRVIPQGFRMDGIYLPEYKKNDVPTFVYSGGVGIGQRNPLKLLEYLEGKDIDYKAIFYTNQPDFFNKYHTNQHVELREYVERDVLLQELAKADFLLNLDNGTTRQLPSKLIDYAITGRPILNINVNDIDREIINQFLNSDYSNRLKVSPKEDYDIVNIAKKFTNLAAQ